MQVHEEERESDPITDNESSKLGEDSPSLINDELDQDY